MENKLDQLFKNKLGKREEIPSPQAWSQINSQLKSGRKKLWMKRLAIAASILLLATIGVGVFNLERQYTDKNLSKSIHVGQAGNSENVENQVGYRMDKVFSKIIGLDSGTIREQIKEQNSLSDSKQANESEIPLESELKSEVKIEKPVMTKIKVPERKNNLAENIDSSIKKNEMSDVLPENSEPIDTQKAQKSMPVDAEAKLPLLAENPEVNEISEATSAMKNRKVTIIYKASKNSTLVEPGKKNLIEKGIGEITKFSNDHLLTENRKAQLSQKKENLMAMNFGKLFNNSIEDKKD